MHWRGHVLRSKIHCVLSWKIIYSRHNLHNKYSLTSSFSPTTFAFFTRPVDPNLVSNGGWWVSSRVTDKLKLQYLDIWGWLVVEPVIRGQGVDDLSDPSWIHPWIRLTQGGIYIVTHSGEKWKMWPPACYWNSRTKSVHLLSYFIEKFSLWHCCNLLFLLECVNHFSPWNILLWKNTHKEHLLRTICLRGVGCVVCSVFLVECSECSVLSLQSFW